MKKNFSVEQIDRIIEMAWEDRTPFEAITFQFGISEAETIAIMRTELKRSSFNLWRKRVNSGISQKHLKKMSDYSTENWGEIWDALFWNFMSKNQEFFRKNPRLSMMLITWNKMTEQQKELHLVRAQNFLEKLHQ